MLGLWTSGPAPIGVSLHVAFTASLDDVRLHRGASRQLGVTPLSFDPIETDEPSVIAWMPAAAVYFRDPDGHLLEYLAMLDAPADPAGGILGYADWVGRRPPMSRTLPLLLAVTAATSWAAATLRRRSRCGGLEPLDVLGLELLSSAIAMLCLTAAARRPLLPPNWGAFAALGVIEPGLAFGLVDFGFARTGAADGAILIASQSLFGVVLARLLLAERVPRPVGAAVAVGFAGSALVGLAESGHGASILGDLLVVGAWAAAAVNGVGVRRLARDADTLSATTSAARRCRAVRRACRRVRQRHGSRAPGRRRHHLRHDRGRDRASRRRRPVPCVQPRDSRSHHRTRRGCCSI